MDKKILSVSDIVDTLKGYEGFEKITKKDIKLAIEAAFVEIKDKVLKEDCGVNIPGFGKFIKITREGTSEGFGKKHKYKSQRVAFKAFKDCKIKG